MNSFALLSKNSHNTVTLKPFSYLKPSIKSTAILNIIILALQIILLVVTKSYSAVIVIACALAGSLLADIVYGRIVKRSSVSWIIAVIQGLVIGFLLPENYFPAAVLIITFVSLMFSKYAFGDFASSWANPVAVTVALCYFLNMAVFPSYGLTAADLQLKNPALAMIEEGRFSTYFFDAPITEFLNKTVFSIFDVSVPDGYVSLFWDSGSPIPAFRFNFLTILSSILLISLDMIDIVIPLCYLIVYTLLVRFLSPVMVGGLPCQGDIILALLTSGTLFSTLFVLQWYGTVPVTNVGKIFYGIISGIVGFFIIGCGTSPTGYVFMVLLMNIISPVIQVFESKHTRVSIERVLLPRLNEIKEGSHV